MLSTLNEPPEPGSLQESALILFVLQEDLREFTRLKLLIQAVVDKEEGLKAFNDFTGEAFPYIEATRKKDKQQHIETLMKELKRGVLAVKPIQEEKMRSRLKSRLIERSEVRSAKEQSKFYEKLGQAAVHGQKLHR